LKTMKNSEVIILLGAGPLGRRLWQELARFVYEGGGIVIASASAQAADPAGFLESIPAEFQPGRIIGVQETSSRISIRFSDAYHPLAESLRDAVVGGFEDLAVRKYVKVSGAAGEFKPVLLFENGDPALCARNYGEGTVLFYSMSFDDIWSDFPKRRSFLPFCHEIVKYASRSMERRLNFNSYERVFFNTLPDFEMTTLADGSTALSVDWTAFESSQYVPDGPGNFAVLSRPQKAYAQKIQRVKCFSVNVDTRGVTFERIGDEALRELIPGALRYPSPEHRRLDAAIGRGRKGIEIYHYLIFALLLFLTFETFFSNRFYGRARGG